MIKTLLQRLVKLIAYTAAGIVILLAIAVGLFRLFLPRLPEYQEDIKGWASAAIGMSVEFTDMDARWGLSGPEIEFYNAELISNETMARIVAADEVSVGVALIRLLADRKFVVDRVVVRDTTLEVRQLENGDWWIQGSPPDQLIPARRPGAGAGDIQIIGEDIQIQFLQPGDERPRLFDVPRFTINRDAVRTAVDATVGLPQDLGGRMTVAATQLVDNPETAPGWNLVVEIDDVELPGVSTLLKTDLASFDSGNGALDMSVAIDAGQLSGVTANVDFSDVALAGRDAFSVSGVFEFRRDDDGWLAAANDFRLQTLRGSWPQTMLRVDAGTNDDGSLATLDVAASYVKLTDIDVILPWLPGEQGALVTSYAPDGEVYDLDVSLGRIGSDAMRFDVSVDLADFGIAAVEQRPGVRGFSGRLRADRSGGRLEIDSVGLTLNAERLLGVPAVLDEAKGTLIWRRSRDRMTLLSDSILLRNADFDIEANVEVTLPDDGVPTVDLAANWSVSDLSTAKHYIPNIPNPEVVPGCVVGRSGSAGDDTPRWTDGQVSVRRRRRHVHRRSKRPRCTDQVSTALAGCGGHRHGRDH